MRWILGAAILPWVGGCREAATVGGGWPASDGIDYALPDRPPDTDADTDADDADTELVGCDTVLTGDTLLTRDIGPCFGDGLNVAADDVTLDCEGHALIGAGIAGSVGVRIAGAAGVTVRNCRVGGFDDAFRVESGFGNRLASNEAFDALRGYVVEGSTANTLVGSRATGCDVGFALTDATVNQVEGNTVDGGRAGFVLGGATDGNTLATNTVTGVEEAGFHVDGAPGNQFTGNVVTASGYGFFLDEATENVLEANVASGNRVTGLHLLQSARNVLRLNDADDNGTHGVCFFGFSAPNLVEENAACGNGTFDAEQFASDGSVYVGNDFCTTHGI